MEWLTEKLLWLWNNPEVTWSGAGITGLGVLYFLLTKLFASRLCRESTTPVSNTFTNSSKGEQNIAQGKGAIGQQNNYSGNSASNSGSGAVAQSGGVAAGHSGVAVGGDLQGDLYSSGGADQYIAQDQATIIKDSVVYIDGNQPESLAVPRYLPPLETCFLGRDKELVDLIDQLHPGKVVAVCGPGGMGKSALAAQVVQKLDELEEDRFPDGIIFLSFYQQPTTDQALQKIAEAFQIEVKADLSTAVQTVLAGKKALLVLDGTEEAEDLKTVLDLRSTCGVLITSRKKTDAQGTRIDLKPLKDKPAAEVFCEHSGLVTDNVSVQGICKILDGWPVGLRIAGRYISSTAESAADYLRWLEKEPFKELGSGEHQEDNAVLLLRRSMSQVSDDARLALGLVGTLAFAPISREPVAAILDGDEHRSRKALNELVNYGLLEKRKERWQVSHALVHTYARKELALSRESLERLAGAYIHACHAANKQGSEGYAFLNSEREHCLRIIEACLNNKIWLAVQGLVLVIQDYLDRQGWWTGRLAALNMRLTAARHIDDRGDEGSCLNDLGCTYKLRGEDKQALACFEQSLRIHREVCCKKGEGNWRQEIRRRKVEQHRRHLLCAGQFL